MPSTHFLPIFVLCPHFCNWAHCHLVEIFTSWIWIGLVTVRTHLESRLSGSMGRVISLCSISPSAYFCLHRWCAASSVSVVRHCQPPATPSPSPWPSTAISWRQEAGDHWHKQREKRGKKIPGSHKIQHYQRIWATLQLCWIQLRTVPLSDMAGGCIKYAADRIISWYMRKYALKSLKTLPVWFFFSSSPNWNCVLEPLGLQN